MLYPTFRKLFAEALGPNDADRQTAVAQLGMTSNVIMRMWVSGRAAPALNSLLPVSETLNADPIPLLLALVGDQAPDLRPVLVETADKLGFKLTFEERAAVPSPLPESVDQDGFDPDLAA